MGSVADFSLSLIRFIPMSHRSAEFCVIGIFVQSGRFPYDYLFHLQCWHMELSASSAFTITDDVHL